MTAIGGERKDALGRPHWVKQVISRRRQLSSPLFGRKYDRRRPRSHFSTRILFRLTRTCFKSLLVANKQKCPVKLPQTSGKRRVLLPDDSEVFGATGKAEFRSKGKLGVRESREVHLTPRGKQGGSLCPNTSRPAFRRKSAKTHERWISESPFSDCEEDGVVLTARTVLNVVVPTAATGVVRSLHAKCWRYDIHISTDT